eukprot:TRINITY_DN5832_c0_g1_i3.p2 TRINITY_DN5832_c0_g1~~TRINITY_DN5832_c0_g1_i3.p2  ORF type:complete len:186 (-),score=80.49 TRINITY_DN5832_c0_g1_i3:539-1096(-)
MSAAAAKAEEERLERTLNRKAAGGGAGGVPEWKRRQQEREREAKAKADADAALKKAQMDAIAANANSGARAQEPAKTWEPPRRKQTLEEVANELSAPAKLASGAAAPAAAPARAVDTRSNAVTCAGCHVMIVGGYKNALGKPWHTDCWKCGDCDQPLQSKFANMGGQPLCVPCAIARKKNGGKKP